MVSCKAAQWFAADLGQLPAAPESHGPALQSMLVLQLLRRDAPGVERSCEGDIGPHVQHGLHAPLHRPIMGGNAI